MPFLMNTSTFWYWPFTLDSTLASNSAIVAYTTNTDDIVNFPGDSFIISFTG